MKAFVSTLAVILTHLSQSLNATSLAGMYGQNLSGVCVPTHPAIQNMQNTANLLSPMAVVEDGPEFTATFTDTFSQQWQCSVDFLDNYQVVFEFSSPNPSANIGSGELIRWHFYDFDFVLGDLQKAVIPPLQDRSIPSFDADDVYMGFSGFTAYEPWNSYTYQLVPVPEPATFTLFGLGSLALVMVRRGAVLETDCRAGAQRTRPITCRFQVRNFGF